MHFQLSNVYGALEKFVKELWKDAETCFHKVSYLKRVYTACMGSF